MWMTGTVPDNPERGERTIEDGLPFDDSGSEETALATGESDSNYVNLSRPSVIYILETEEGEDKTLPKTSRGVTYKPLSHRQDSLYPAYHRDVQAVSVNTGEFYQSLDSISKQGGYGAPVNYEKCQNKSHCTDEACPYRTHLCVWPPQFQHFSCLSCCYRYQQLTRGNSASSQGHHVTNIRANQKSFLSPYSGEIIRGREWQSRHVTTINDRSLKIRCKDKEASSISGSREGSNSSGALNIMKDEEPDSTEDRKTTIHQACLGEEGDIALKQEEQTRKPPSPWLHRKTTIHQACLGEEENIALKQEEQTRKPPSPWLDRESSIHQAYLGEEGDIALKQEKEKRKRPSPWLDRESSIHQAYLGEEGDIALKQEKEKRKRPSPWLYRKTTIHQACLGEEGGIALKQERRNSISERKDESAEFKQVHDDSDDNMDSAISPLFKEESATRINDDSPSWNHTSKRQSFTRRKNEGQATKGTTCPVCNKKLKRAYYLKNHMLIHTGHKPYQCVYCSKTFNQVGNKNAHQRIHTGEKPYACEYCGKRFVFNSSKYNHMKVHGFYLEGSNLDEPDHEENNQVD